PLTYLLEKSGSIVVRRIPGRGNDHIHSQRVPRVESGIYIQQANEASDQQAGSGQERERQRDFGDEHTVCDALLQPPRATSPAFLQHMAEFRRGNLKRRNQTKEKSGAYRDEQRE